MKAILNKLRKINLTEEGFRGNSYLAKSYYSCRSFDFKISNFPDQQAIAEIQATDTKPHSSVISTELRKGNSAYVDK